jgi:sucrose-6-phosphate hydrolase SacC (GH32 family)
MINPGKFLSGGACSILALTAVLTGCGGDSTSAPKSNVKLIVLEEGQSWQDVVSSRSSASNSSSTSSLDSGLVLTTEPATEGNRLFVRKADTNQNISGFEFCCGKYDTYQKHEFTDATGDFLKLDGGFWGSGVQGTLGERLFSSYGDGIADAPDATMAQLGWSATGSVMSPEFDINTKYINFLVGGGANRFDSLNPTAIALVVDGKVVRQSHGENEQDKIVWDSWDVRDLNGKKGKIKFIDGHPNDNSDAAVPYILADEFRAADKAAVAPAADSKVALTATIASEPATAGSSLFKRLTDQNQNIAGFEFCCGKYDTYQNHSFLVTGDFIYFDGGEWAVDITNKLGERVFASYANGFAEPNASSPTWYGWEATGTLTTPVFKINSSYINFLVGGGTNAYNQPHATAVVLRVNGKVVRHATGNGKEKELSWASWDVSALKGQDAVIEIIDQHDDSTDEGAFPFILADEFRQADTAAVQPDQSQIATDAAATQNLQIDMGDANPFYRDGEYYIYYLANAGFHDWQLVKTSDLLTGSFPVKALAASGNESQKDQWLGSGSVLKDQSGKFHLFATAHNAKLNPVESVIHATASDNTLLHWDTKSGETFSGSNGYATGDFRDPLVFWNAAAQKYWMLITSRYQSKAAIGLYSSSDLSSWSAENPLYTEASPLNLEVADYFTLGQTPFVVYSDQRDASRQVKYLGNQSNSWVKPAYDALDGKAYYAARTAGTDSERLLFGWVAHKLGRTDAGSPTWGGDLLVHQVKKTIDGELAVSLPQKLVTGLNKNVATEAVWSNNSVSGAISNLNLAANTQFTLAPSALKNRLSLTLTSANADAVAGVQLRNPTSGKSYFVKIDSLNNKASFYAEGDEANSNNPSVNLPLDYTQGIKIDIYLDPIAGVGAVYMNDFRALSFRLYDLANLQVGLFSTGDAIALTELKRYSL